MILVRSLLFNLFFLAMTAALSIYGTIACRHDPARALRLGQCWARLGIGAARHICGIRLEVTGRDLLPAQGPALIASQHQSAFDTMVWLALLPRAAYVLKQELTRIPLFGALAVQAGMIPVDRAAGGRAIRALLHGADTACADHRQIIIFPEGTRARPGETLDLQTGVAALARRTGLAPFPATTDSGRCWGRRAFSKSPGIVHVAILPPIPPQASRQILMQRLAEALRPVDKPVEPLT